MNAVLGDFRFALRVLGKSPAFLAVAIVTLALAIGVNSAVFSLINGLILKPLIPHKPAEVVSVFTARKESNRDYRQFSYTEFRTLAEARDAFSDVTAVNFSLAGIARGQEPMRRAFIFLVSDNFFHFMGVQPAGGRFFTPEEGRPNANIPVVVASYGLWQRMGGTPDFVGSTLRLNGRPHTVIGISPAGFSGISGLIAPEVWLPLGLHTEINSAFSDGGQVLDLNNPKNYTLNVMARLQPGLTLDTVKPRLPVIAQRLTAIQPHDALGTRELQVLAPSRFSISTTPSDDGPLGLMSVLLAGMAAIVLLIASLNLINMILARGTARSREIAMRLAIGATRWQIVRQLLVEGLVLSIAGGLVGLALAAWTNTLLQQSFSLLLGSMNFSLTTDLRPDSMVLAATIGFCVLATVIFSLGPALKASRADVVGELKTQGAESTASGRLNRFFAPRHVLVMAQMTLSLVLIFSAGLFFRGALKAGGLELGFEPAGVLLTEMDFSLANTPQADAMRRVELLTERVRRLPGVKSVGWTTLVPYGNLNTASRVVPANAPPVKSDPNGPEQGAYGVSASVTPDYFDTIGVPLLRGRTFTALEAQKHDTPRVCILDEGLAKKLFPDKDALGQRIRLTQAPADGSPADMEIVGIVARHRHDVMDDNGPARRIYFPLAQSYSPGMWLSVRYSSKDPASVQGALQGLRTELRQADADLPILQQLPFVLLLDKSVSLWLVRLGAVTFGVFGGIALLLAVVGVYGVKAYAVERRTREIGIRLALGADRRDVFSLIAMQGLLQTAVSVGLGLALSILVGQVLSSMLFAVSPADPISLTVAAVLLSTAALLACYLPARRATRVSPLTALRTE
jgi:putative ABC transport system permease protein